ncbi:MAG: hypothetical protein JWR16_399, partial [Nevskia sp.]|nr:hypothetical protein [Nevskia sp.]
MRNLKLLAVIGVVAGGLIGGPAQAGSVDLNFNNYSFA